MPHNFDALAREFATSALSQPKDGGPFEFLKTLWNIEDEREEMAASQPSRKRKLEPDSAADSTNPIDSETPTSSTPGSSLVVRNVLLAGLLSKKPTSETVVNTHTVSAPTATPQTRLPKDLTKKILDIEQGSVEPNNNVNANGESRHENKLPGSRANNVQNSGQGVNIWSNPRTNPNTPYPGNTDPIANTLLGQGQGNPTGMGLGNRSMASSQPQGGTPASSVATNSGVRVSSTSGGGGIGAIASSQLPEGLLGPRDPSQGQEETSILSLDPLTSDDTSILDDIEAILVRVVITL